MGEPFGQHGIPLELPLMTLHFERLITEAPERELHFTLRRYENARLTMSFDGAEYSFPLDWYANDPRDCVNAFVKAECTRLGRADLLERFQGL
jgi:hypothetical protein